MSPLLVITVASVRAFLRLPSPIATGKRRVARGRYRRVGVTAGRRTFAHKRRQGHREDFGSHLFSWRLAFNQTPTRRFADTPKRFPHGATEAFLAVDQSLDAGFKPCFTKDSKTKRYSSQSLREHRDLRASFSPSSLYDRPRSRRRSRSRSLYATGKRRVPGETYRRVGVTACWRTFTHQGRQGRREDFDSRLFSCPLRSIRRRHAVSPTRRYVSP